MKIVDSAEFIDMLNLSIYDDKHSSIDFNDEIVSIEEIGEKETLDIDVTGNHLFYANDILTHNSATGSSLDIKNVGNDSISDSLGSAMTADFIVFLLQTEEMKKEKLMTCKVTKNRFNGRTDTWNMNIDYTHMRFHDAIVQDGGMSEEEVKKEIDIIKKEDIEKIKRHDNSLNEEFDVMAELGLE